MKYINDLQISLNNIVNRIDILKKLMIYIDYIMYFFVTLSFLGKLAFLNLYLSSIFNIIFFAILILSFASKKYVNMVVIFFNNIILYIFELISVLMHEYIFLTDQFIPDIIFKDISMIFMNIIFLTLSILIIKKFNANIL